jgi:hypothetical protein
MISIRTVRQGKRVAVWDVQGNMRLVDGPRRLVLWRHTVEDLRQFAAEAGQYLVVRFRDGHAEHVRGPAAVWFDPILHESIKVEQALSINAHEAVVVYRRAGEGVSRRVVRGPALFIPTEDEWLHEFRWHGADPRDPTRKIPNALQFTKLWVIPDQMYFDVREVRTADDALLVIKVMVFFELVNIEQMLDQTHDPVADFVNALSADVIEFVAGRPFEAFKGQTERLNDLATYPNLCSRAERIGYRINKVVYRGYTASNKLQAMHDDAIETRTQLKLEAETEAQAQELADLKLEREAQRAARQREMEVKQAEHAQALKEMAHGQQLRHTAAEQDQRVRHQRIVNEVELEKLRARNQEQAAFLQTVRGMEVDMTRYLVAQYQHPDRLIRIDGKDAPQVHVHEQ